MFSRNREEGSVADGKPLRLGQQPPVRSRNVSVIGPTLVFKGELSADEDLVIEGTIEGTIAHHKKNLTVGKQGRVTADIHASSVLVEGTLQGNIHSDGLVSLAKTAVVEGDIFCARLVFEDGASFTGHVDMAKPNPLKIADTGEESEEPMVAGDAEAIRFGSQ